MKGYCIECHKENYILIDKIIENKEEKKYIGKCEDCGERICRVVIKK